MSKRPGKQNPKPAGGDELKGGTEPGNAPEPNVGTQPGGTNALTPAGGSHPTNGAVEQSGGTRTDDRYEPEELYEGTRKPSPAVAKEKARDGADVDTTHGFPPAPGNPEQWTETQPRLEEKPRTGAAEVTDASTGEKAVGEKK
jgi:hypothetical protein